MFLQCILLPLVGAVSAVVAYFAEKRESLSWVKRLLLGLTVLSIVGQAVSTGIQEKAAKEESENLNKELKATRTLLQDAMKDLTRANENLGVQARSIGSLVFNLGTSDEGKRRFVDCFHDLSRITRRREKPIVYEGLICDNGVAIFGFEQEPECLEEFYFFTEAEINHVLSGTRLEYGFVNKSNEVCVASHYELTFIDNLTRARVPSGSDDPIEHEKATARVDELMKTVFRYVYRSVGTNLAWWQEQNTGRPVERRITFSYAADPLADAPRILCAELNMPLNEFESYFGLSIRDFNARLIEACRVRGIEPKVRIKDIRGMDARARGKEDHRTFPYQK